MSKKLSYVSAETNWGSTFINPTSVFSVGRQKDRYRVFTKTDTYGALPSLVESFLVLEENGVEIDSFSNDNKAKYYNAVHYSSGDVLLSGVGLGYLVLSLARRKCVESVTVFEPDQALWEFVWPGWREITIEEESDVISVIHDEKELRDDYDWVICRNWPFFSNSSQLVKSSFGMLYHDNVVNRPLIPTDWEWKKKKPK